MHESRQAVIDNNNIHQNLKNILKYCHIRFEVIIVTYDLVSLQERAIDVFSIQ